MTASSATATPRVGHVTVVGAGQIGTGLAQACVRGGLEVALVDPNGEARTAAQDRIGDWLKSKGIERDVACHEVLDSVGRTDLIVEATPEDRKIKLDVLSGLAGRHLDEHTILATTTSAIPISELAEATCAPHRFAGLHVFHPVPAMPVVELVPAVRTEGWVLDALTGLIEGPLNKTAVRAPDRPGFLVNALIIPYVVAAVRLHEETGAAPSDIDTLIRGAVGNPLGPLQLADFMGIDTLRSIAEVLHQADPQRNPAPPAVLGEMAASGRLGRKSGQGFYMH